MQGSFWSLEALNAVLGALGRSQELSPPFLEAWARLVGTVSWPINVSDSTSAAPLMQHDPFLQFCLSRLKDLHWARSANPHVGSLLDDIGTMDFGYSLQSYMADAMNLQLNVTAILNTVVTVKD